MVQLTHSNESNIPQVQCSTEILALFFHEYLPNLRQLHISKNIWPISNESNSINDDDEQPADKVTGGERPLGEKLLDGFEFKDDEGETYNLTGAIELHRLVLQDYDQLKKRKNEITRKIIDSTCAIDVDDEFYKEVSQSSLPILPRSRHCFSLVGTELIKPLKQRPYS